MKHFLIFLTAALLPCLFFGAACTAETLTCIVADGQYVNVRNQPSPTAAAWGILHTGDTIEASPAQITDGFFKTTFNTHVAYVSVRYFEIPVDKPYVVSSNGRVRLRRSPKGEADGFISPGRQVHVLAWRYAADGSRWARCTGGSYISAACLRPAQ